MKKVLRMVMLLMCFCVGCTKAGNEVADTSENTNTESVTESEIESTDSVIETETADIDSLIGSELPLSHYNYSISGAMLSENITDYMVEDREQFRIWTQEELFYAGVLQKGGAEVGIGVIPVEFHTERMKYKALKLDNGIYIVDTYGGLEILREGEGVHLSAETMLKICGRRTELGFVDALGTGTPQLRIAGYDSGTGYCREGVFVFDMENMCFVEFEDSEKYIMEAYRECAESYIADGGVLKERYKFYLTDRTWNVFNGGRPWMENDEFFYHEVSVKYSMGEPVGREEEEQICRIKVIYEYSPEQNMFCVARVETM